MKKNILLLLSFFMAGLVFAQKITTAGEYFDSVSKFYGTIKDYEANVEITASHKQMAGKISFKRPDLLRIDFTNPADQVICFNGDTLTIYLPGYSAILNQQVQSDGSSAGGAGLATPAGLSLLRRYYRVSYESGQNPVPLDENSEEKVINLILRRKTATESFIRIKLSITPDTKLIRRVDAVTSHNAEFIFDFHDYKLNSNIPDQRFIYNAPSSANNYNNFLFTE